MKKYSIKFAAISAAVSMLLVSGCAQTSFHMQERDDGAVATMDEPQHYFISGLGQRKDIDPVKICAGRDKVMKVETEFTFVNGLVAGLTFGIYTPQQTRVYCSR